MRNDTEIPEKALNKEILNIALLQSAAHMPNGVLFAGKMLPPHPHGNDPSESHEGADADTPSASVAAAVSEQADRIIAAASSGAPLPKGESGISSDELTGSVSTTGEPEAVVEAGKVVPEIAISQGEVAAESPFVGKAIPSASCSAPCFARGKSTTNKVTLTSFCA